MSRRSYVVTDKKSSDWWTIWAAAALLAFGKVLMIVGVIAIACWCLYQIGCFIDKHRSKAVAVEDYYDGIYPHETMPLTYPMCDTFPYRDFDDGLRGWK